MARAQGSTVMSSSKLVVAELSSSQGCFSSNRSLVRPGSAALKQIRRSPPAPAAPGTGALKLDAPAFNCGPHCATVHWKPVVGFSGSASTKSLPQATVSAVPPADGPTSTAARLFMVRCGARPPQRPARTRVGAHAAAQRRIRRGVSKVRPAQVGQLQVRALQSRTAQISATQQCL